MSIGFRTTAKLGCNRGSADHRPALRRFGRAVIVGMVDREILDERELRRLAGLAEKLARRKHRTGKEQDVN